MGFWELSGSTQRRPGRGVLSQHMSASSQPSVASSIRGTRRTSGMRAAAGSWAEQQTTERRRKEDD